MSPAKKVAIGLVGVIVLALSFLGLMTGWGDMQASMESVYEPKAIYAQAHTQELIAQGEMLKNAAVYVVALGTTFFGGSAAILAIGGSLVMIRLAWAAGRTLELGAEARHVELLTHSLGTFGAAGYLANADTLVGRRLRGAGLLSGPDRAPTRLVADQPVVMESVRSIRDSNSDNSKPHTVARKARKSTTRH